MRITVDPSTSSDGFGYAAEGRYTLRVSKVEQKIKEGGTFPYLKWTFDFADPNVKSISANNPKVGSIFENTTLKSGDNSQFRLKGLCDALGVTWGDFDTDELIGNTFDAQVNIDNYEGTFSNKVNKFIPRGK